jgi:hypothetical protein
VRQLVKNELLKMTACKTPAAKLGCILRCRACR